ncbi:hypothetical protein ROHU_034032 [Labeo rohita]|uniref:Uncharacterized protein n=1 Tax=Labeo rohita TaxID=84645 RepID=A0A498LF79_LABRO|nr:hypothetical protein ROHU_034032 [Labeo rohita]
MGLRNDQSSRYQLESDAGREITAGSVRISNWWQRDPARMECLHGTRPEQARSEQLPGEYHDFRGTSSLKKAVR